jgi:hypothetical protein
MKLFALLAAIVLPMAESWALMAGAGTTNGRFLVGKNKVRTTEPAYISCKG